MPYPGRRNLPDVMATVTDTIATFDAGLQNQVLLKEMLTFLFSQGFGVEDPAGLADAILDFELPPPPAELPPEAPARSEPVPAHRTAPAACPNDEKSQYGEKRRGSAPKNEMSEQVEDAGRRGVHRRDRRAVAAAHGRRGAGGHGGGQWQRPPGP